RLRQTTLGWGFEPQITRLGGGCPLRARLPERVRRGPESPLILRHAGLPGRKAIAASSLQEGYRFRVLPESSRKPEVPLSRLVSEWVSPWSPSPASSVSSRRPPGLALLSAPPPGPQSLSLPPSVQRPCPPSSRIPRRT